MKPPRTFPTTERTIMIERADGRCEAVLVLGGEPCGEPLPKRAFELHHIKEHADGGPNKASNGWVVCGDCHKVLTARYAARRAKAAGAKAHHLGAKAPPKQPLGKPAEERKTKHESHLSHLPRRDLSGKVIR